jgi:ATP-dependent phosphofructokinase / diphosphate-dependent phosphofructokinase
LTLRRTRGPNQVAARGFAPARASYAWQIGPMTPRLKRIAINTGGGDAPGLNAVIHAAVHAAEKAGIEVFGIREGYDGILEPQDYPEGGIVQLNRRSVAGIAHLGGTILGTTNRGNPFARRTQQADGSWVEKDRSDEVLRKFSSLGIDALIAVGGDGSLGLANRFAQRGLRVVGVPKTIDNDLDATVQTFGFDSAVEFATECIDRLHSTAASHRRILVVEVMGRYAGWIALHSGLAGAADAILIPEIPYDLKTVAAHLCKKANFPRSYCIVVVAEGATPVDGQLTVRAREAGRDVQLGGVGEQVARELGTLTGKETRVSVLGHIVRGGSPTASDRNLGLALGAGAVRALIEGQDRVMVAVNPPNLVTVPLAVAVAKTKKVPLDDWAISTARALDISFGDSRSIPTLPPSA